MKVCDRKIFYINVGDMSVREAEEFLMKLRKKNTIRKISIISKLGEFLERHLGI